MKQFAKKTAVSIDRFGENFNFYVMDNQTEYRTVTGCILTLLILPAILPFAVHKFNVMLGYGDTNIVISTQQHYFSNEFTMSSAVNDLQVAFAFVDYDSKGHDHDLSQYGTVKAFYKTWGDDSNPGTHYKEIDSRPCTKEELGVGLETGGTRFWPLHPNEVHEHATYENILQCIDGDIEIFGSYNSAVA